MTPFVAEIIGNVLILLGNGDKRRSENQRQQFRMDCYYRWMGICRFRLLLPLRDQLVEHT
jgi:hypothetical protein